MVGLPGPPAADPDEAFLRGAVDLGARRRRRGGLLAPAAVDPLPVIAAQLPAAVGPAHPDPLALPVAGQPGPAAALPVPAPADPDEAELARVVRLRARRGRRLDREPR